MDTSRNKTSLLIIEDDRGTAQALELKSRGVGLDPVVMSKGKEALDYLIEHGAKVVLLDMLLNDISGLDLLEQLQGSDVLADASIIAFTASDDQKLKDRSLELGASEFFYKPETGIDELFSSVLKHLAQ